MPPSRKRLLLALYLDYLAFTAFYQPIAWIVRSSVPADNWLTALAIFALLRGVAWLLRLTSPGQWALGIQPGPSAAVHPAIRARERWWTAAAGTVLVLEGSKNLVRWTQGLPVAPWLGTAAPEWAATVAISVLGALNVAAGLLVLRTRRSGALIGIGVIGAEIAATLLNRDAFQRWTAEAVVAKRTFQGLPIRDGEVEIMQMLTATALPALMAVGALWLLAVVVRFRAQGPDSAASCQRCGERMMSHPSFLAMSRSALPETIETARLVLRPYRFEDVEQRIGMRREGTLRQNRITRGEAVDEVWFGILRPEWRPWDPVVSGEGQACHDPTPRTSAALSPPCVGTLTDTAQPGQTMIGFSRVANTMRASKNISSVKARSVARALHSKAASRKTRASHAPITHGVTATGRGVIRFRASRVLASLHTSTHAKSASRPSKSHTRT